MGNEFGHPEWIDFPRQGNNWSYHYARRQWSLVDNPDLRYAMLNRFDRDMIHLVRSEKTLEYDWPYLVLDNRGDQVLAFGRGELVFVFNFSPTRSYSDYGIGTGAGKFRIELDTDRPEYGGQGRVDDGLTYYTQTDFEKRHWLKLYLPARCALVLKRIQVRRVHS